MRYVCLIVTMACFSTPVISSRANANPALEQRRAELNRLISDEWEYEMREAPEFATVVGDLRYNDRWSDNSLAHIRQQRVDLESWLTRFSAIDTTGFPEQEKLNQVLMLRNLKMRIEDIETKTIEMPIDQFFGAHLQIANFVNYIPFNTTKQYDDYLNRLRGIPPLLDQITEVLRQGEKHRMFPPRFLLERCVEQARSIAEPAGEASAFAQPLKQFPDAIPGPDRRRLHDAMLAAIDNNVRPAYRKLADFLATDYAPKGRTEYGIWALPEGDALYRHYIRRETTTNMDPEQIHEIGLKEVARLEGEQLAIAQKLGFSDLRSLRASLKTNAKLFRHFTPAVARPLSPLHRADVTQATHIVRIAAAREDRSAPCAGVSGERLLRRRVSPGYARRLASGSDHGQHWRLSAPNSDGS
jgi:uncharacterized protein (DUF885 family)